MKKQHTLIALTLAALGACQKIDFNYNDKNKIVITSVDTSQGTVTAYLLNRKDSLVTLTMFGVGGPTPLNIVELYEDFVLTNDSLIGITDRPTASVIGWEDVNGDDENYRLVQGLRMTIDDFCLEKRDE